MRGAWLLRFTVSLDAGHHSSELKCSGQAGYRSGDKNRLLSPLNCSNIRVNNLKHPAGHKSGRDEVELNGLHNNYVVTDLESPGNLT